jgi:hypothetical protein
MIDERLIVLLDAYLDGALTPEEKQELERVLLESDAARRQFWERASLHGWTYAAAKLNYGAKPTEEVARERRRIHEASFAAIRNWLRPVISVGWKLALVGAACVIAVLVWNRFHQPEPADEEDLSADTAAEPGVSNSIATLTRGTGVVWQHETIGVEVGSVLAPGWLRLKAGAVQIEFDSGARVILEGPAELQLISPGEAQLRTGKLSARVPEPAHGFKIYTPDATVTDLGTEFGLNLEKSKPAQVEVFEGKVELAVDGTNQPQLLNAGEGVQIDSHRTEPMAAVNRSVFLSAEELARRESAELRLRYQSWKQVDQLLDRDSAVLVHFNFEDRKNVDRNLVNCAGGMHASARAMIFGCDWVDGRWPGKGALQFNRLNDRVRLTVPGEFQSLTYLAWVRVDSLPNSWDALALVDTHKQGETHWQLHRNGTMEFSVRPVGGKPGWDHLISRPIITHQELGQWVQLAAVYDGETGKMSLYLNGRQVASKNAKRRVPLTLGALELGNWSPTARKAPANYRIRDFHGRMDEFALLSRPLSSEEIARLYELGKPRETTEMASLERGASAKP